MVKLSYEAVAVAMEPLWLKLIDPSDTISIDNHCLYLRSFIESCGWDVDNYIAHMISYPNKYRYD